jgi:hypothetical protein
MTPITPTVHLRLFHVHDIDASINESDLMHASAAEDAYLKVLI